MNFIIKNISGNPVNLLRRSGYVFQRNVDTGEMSFVRELASSGYPRFHAYTTLSGRDLKISIHIDHKKNTYGDDTRHHGEYDNSGALGPEIERLKNSLSNVNKNVQDFNI